MAVLSFLVGAAGVLIALVALVRENQTRRELHRTVLAPNLRPLLERASDLLGSVAAADGKLSPSDSEAIVLLDRRLGELRPGVIDEKLQSYLLALTSEVVNLRGGLLWRSFGKGEKSLILEWAAHWQDPQSAARRGPECADSALKRLSELQAGR